MVGLGKLYESSEDEGEDIEMLSPPQKKSLFDSSSDSECDEPPKKKSKPPADPRVDEADDDDDEAPPFVDADDDVDEAPPRGGPSRGWDHEAPPPPRDDAPFSCHDPPTAAEADELFAAARFVAGLPARYAALVEAGVVKTVAAAPLTADRHAVLADEMGLGKTVESLAGAELRRAVAAARAASAASLTRRSDAALGGACRRAERGVMDHSSGASSSSAARRGAAPSRARAADATLGAATKGACEFDAPKPCALFPRASAVDLRKLGVLKRAKQNPQEFAAELESGRSGEQHPDLVDYVQLMHKGEDDESALIRDLVAGALPSAATAFTFDVVLVDEAHLLKNDATWWSVGAALLGHHSRRFVGVTGTPFCNSYKDVAAIVGYGDARARALGRRQVVGRRDLRQGGAARPRQRGHRRAHAALARPGGDRRRGGPRDAAPLPAPQEERRPQGPAREARRVSDAVALIRAIEDAGIADAGALDAEALIAANDDAQPSECKVYLLFEQIAYRFYGEFCAAMTAYKVGPRTAKLKARCHKLMVLACTFITMAKTALIHPVLPSEGRAITTQFVPKRKNFSCKKCSLGLGNCCAKHVTTAADSDQVFGKIIADGKGFKGDPVGGPDPSKPGDDAEPEPEADADSAAEGGYFDPMVADESSDKKKSKQPVAPRASDKLVDLPKPFCVMRHKAHPGCYDEARRRGWFDTPGGCPGCKDLLRRLKMGSHPSAREPKLYCAEVAFGGFALSTKLESALAIIRDRCLVKREKMIVYAGNKGALDLLEAVVIHEREFDGCDAVRYDGDVDAAKRNSELARFKATPSCRVLFATVDTAGVGLNIVEACNVLFLDRWFNPTRQDQAMDRCHRYGQTKPVDVRFLDSEDTIDDVMRLINEYKQGNAKTLFAGSRELPELAQKGVTWLELENVVKEKFHEIFKSRARSMGIEHVLQTVFDNLPDQDGDDGDDDDGAAFDDGAASTPRR
ncbi:ATP binding protein [Aureococcus anophagefferens]|nr:ATP binding protein [Aureococcus anophagefferens]